MRHTAIMATVADHRCTPEFIRALHGEGLDAVRINSAHVTPESIQRMVAVIRSVDSGIKILMDTKGPEIRTADVVAPIRINAGDVVEIISSHCPCSPGRISVMVDNLHQFLSQGCHVLIDDGDLEFEVTHIDGTVVYAKALRSGELQSRKTVNVPGVEIPPLPAVSQRDHENICAARQVGIDMIAHSFVRSADDVAALRREIAGTDIYYTFDNTDPDSHTPKYTDPLSIPKNATWLRIVTYRDGKPVGKVITLTTKELAKRAESDKRTGHGNLTVD